MEADSDVARPSSGGHPSFGTVALSIVSAIIGGIVSAMSAETLDAPWYASLAVGATTLLLFGLYAYYWLTLNSANSNDRRERQDYLSFRRRLAAGGAMGRAYGASVQALLTFSESLFGDRGRTAPNWTAESFDRCLLIATLYPLVCILLFWVASGDVGLAERSLGFHEGATWSRRLLVPAAWIPTLVWLYFYRRMPLEDRETPRVTMTGGGLAGLASLGAGIGAGAYGIAVGGAVAGGVAVLLALWGARLGVEVRAGVFAVAFGVVGAFALAFALFVTGSIGATSHILFGVAFFALLILINRIPSTVWSNVLSVLTLAVSLLVLAPKLYAFDVPAWKEAAALALFLPLMALVNAPFDWLSLGITRRLIRAGLGSSNWKPLLYSMLDLFLALLCLVALGSAIILAIQTFNARLIAEGGESVYDPAAVLRAIADPQQRWESQYWWIYATLFSTFVPSMLNVLVGAAAIARGVSPINEWMLTKLPQRARVTRLWLGVMPALLALLRTTTIALVGAALVGFVYLLLAIGLPLFSLNLLEQLVELAEADWPRHLLAE